MKLTPDILAAATGCTPELAARYGQHLAEACAHYGIDTPGRLAAFLGPAVGHESGSLRHVRELADGSDYEGRVDLGNSEPGDGRRYRGRGLIQITGRANYRAAAASLRAVGAPDFEQNPEAVEAPRWACWTAADWWHRHGCNALADAGEIVKLGRLINRGNANSVRPANGEADRLQRFERAKSALASYAPPRPMLPPAPPPPAAADYMPPGEAPDWTPPQPKESSMDPFTGAALGAVLKVVPDLIDMFKGDSKAATRNSEAAKVVVGVAREALQAKNEQEVVQRLESDPAAADAVREAVRRNWFEVHQAAEKSISDAREFVTRYSATGDVRTVFFRFTFVEFLALVFIGTAWGAIGLLAAFDKVSKETLDNIIMLAAVASIVGVREFWYGSSFGSRQKDDARAN